MPAKYDVDGIMLPRPFKIVRHGPIRLFCRDMKRMEAFYSDIMGFTRTEAIGWRGHRCVFFRCGTEHHSLALYPISLRQKLGLSSHTTVMSFGVQVATYKQLRAAIDFLKGRAASSSRFRARSLRASTTAPTCSIQPGTRSSCTTTWSRSMGRTPAPRKKATPDRVADWPKAVERSPIRIQASPTWALG